MPWRYLVEGILFIYLATVVTGAILGWLERRNNRWHRKDDRQLDSWAAQEWLRNGRSFCPNGCKYHDHRTYKEF